MHFNHKNIIIYYIIPLCFITIVYISINFKIRNDKNVNWEIFKLTKGDIQLDKFLYSQSNINNNKNNNYYNKNFYYNKILVGIDFGSINSGYSYSIEKDFSKIKSNKIFPTEIILSNKDKQNGLIYSNSAPVTMMNYNKNELRKILYIKSLKSIISSKNETLNDNIIYFYPNDLILNIEDDITSYFSLLKYDIMKEIEESDEKKILFIIAIPSNWDEFQKQLIKKSLSNIGMINIKMIYESEAASLCVFHDKFIEDKYKKKKNVFLLIDIGGSSISFSVNKYEDNKGSIKQILSSVKNDIGVIYLTEEIINIFIDLVGEKYINYIKANNPGEWIKFLKEINNAIENTYNINGVEIFELTNIFGISNDKLYKYDNIKYNIKFTKYNVILPSNLVGNIISKCFYKIKLYLDEIMSKLKENNINLNSFILTGGLAQNKIIKSEIKKYAEIKSFSVQYLSSYQNVISKGCIFYGMNPEKLLSKKSPINMGIFSYLKNEMELLIKKGDEINDEINIVLNIKPQLESQRKIQMFIFVTGKDINDKNELKKYFLGRVLICFDKIIENIQLMIKYDTHLMFSALDNKGNELKTEFQFFTEEQKKYFKIME